MQLFKLTSYKYCLSNSNNIHGVQKAFVSFLNTVFGVLAINYYLFFIKNKNL